MTNISKILPYLFYCHRIPERCFTLGSFRFPICSRCTGILVGYPIGIYLLWTPLYPFLSLLLMIPLIIDGTGQYYGKWISNNLRRFVTGFWFGVGTVLFIKDFLIMGYHHGIQLTQALKVLLNGV